MEPFDPIEVVLGYNSFNGIKLRMTCSKRLIIVNVCLNLIGFIRHRFKIDFVMKVSWVVSVAKPTSYKTTYRINEMSLDLKNNTSRIV